MSEADRLRWDRRHSQDGEPRVGQEGPPPVFAPFEHLFPSEGRALDIACGSGRAAVWLARRGMEVLGVDVSPVAIERARRFAALSGMADRCRFEVVDLHDGLPEGPDVDLVLCHFFRDERLDRAIVDRLAPGGILAIAALSEVGSGPGSFRARPGDLREAFADLDVLTEGEGEGLAWLVGRRDG